LQDKAFSRARLGTDHAVACHKLVLSIRCLPPRFENIENPDAGITPG
jgi:hypothetical protein